MSDDVPIWRVNVLTDGTFRLQDKDRPRFQEYVRKFAGKTVELIVRAIQHQRTNAQNRYYFGVVIKKIAEALGYTKDEAHQAVAWHFLQDVDDAQPCPTCGHPMSKKLPRRRSTSSLDIHEFSTYVSDIKQFAAEPGNLTPDGIQIPDSDEIEY